CASERCGAGSAKADAVAVDSPLRPCENRSLEVQYRMSRSRGGIRHEGGFTVAAGNGSVSERPQTDIDVDVVVVGAGFSGLYLLHVTERYDLRKDIDFGTRVESAAWDDSAKRWRLETSTGSTFSCQYYVMATGCLSLPKQVDIEGADRFGGEVYFTSRWPHEG